MTAAPTVARVDDLTRAECSLPGCSRPVKCRSLCNMHYQRWRTRGDTGPAMSRVEQAQPKCRCAKCGGRKDRGANACRHCYEVKPYPVEMIEQVRSLYSEGFTQRQIARRLNTSQKVVFRVMRKHGITARPAVPRIRGPEHHSWAPESANYKTLHSRVYAARGAPQRCSVCDTTTGRMHWANLTGDYEDVDDYARMCASCHAYFDNAVRSVVQA